MAAIMEKRCFKHTSRQTKKKVQVEDAYDNTNQLADENSKNSFVSVSNKNLNKALVEAVNKMSNT